MSDPIAPSALLDGRSPDGGRAMQSAFLRALASLVTAVVIFVVAMLVWMQNERAAGRIIIGAQKADGYVSTVVTQFATMHGRPAGL